MYLLFLFQGPAGVVGPAGAFGPRGLAVSLISKYITTLMQEEKTCFINKDSWNWSSDQGAQKVMLKDLKIFRDLESQLAFSFVGSDLKLLGLALFLGELRGCPLYTSGYGLM